MLFAAYLRDFLVCVKAPDIFGKCARAPKDAYWLAGLKLNLVILSRRDLTVLANLKFVIPLPQPLECCGVSVLDFSWNPDGDGGDRVISFRQESL